MSRLFGSYPFRIGRRGASEPLRQVYDLLCDHTVRCGGARRVA